MKNKEIIGRWFKAVWGAPADADVSVVDELGVPDVLVHYPMHGPKKGRENVKQFLTEFREAFPDLSCSAVGDLIAEGDYVAGRWECSGTHTGPAFSDLPGLPEASGKKMHFTGTTVFRIKNSKIVEEIGEEGVLTALQQLGLVKTESAKSSHV